MLSPGASRPLKRFHNSGRWFRGVPAMFGGAVRKDAFLGARLFLIAAGAANGGVEVVLVQRLPQRLGSS